MQRSDRGERPGRSGPNIQRWGVASASRFSDPEWSSRPRERFHSKPHHMRCWRDPTLVPPSFASSRSSLQLYSGLQAFGRRAFTLPVLRDRHWGTLERNHACSAGRCPSSQQAGPEPRRGTSAHPGIPAMTSSALQAHYALQRAVRVPEDGDGQARREP